MREVPNPDADWGAFMTYVKRCNNESGNVFDVTCGKNLSWIDVKAMTKAYCPSEGNQSSVCVLM